MRGRERAVTDRWIAQLIELTDKLKDIGVATGKPALEGGGVTSTLEPRKAPLKEESSDEVQAPQESASEEG